MSHSINEPNQPQSPRQTAPAAQGVDLPAAATHHDANLPAATDIGAWAKLYRERGFAIAVIKPGEKMPTSLGWNMKSAEPRDFTPDSNIGVLAGALSENDVVVDIDDPMALALAPEYLPPTDMIEGRPGKPMSHWLFRPTNIPPELSAMASASKAGKRFGGPRTKQYAIDKTDVNGQAKSHMIVEILGTGRHAAVPPSLHPSGERRSWHKFGTPAVVDCRELYAAVERLAKACGWQPRVHSIPTALPSLSMNSAAGVEDDPSLPPMAERVKRARAYVAKMEPAISGHGGHKKTFAVACVLVRGFALDLEHAWELLWEYNQRCLPPWRQEELEHKLEGADDFDGPRGGKLIESDDYGVGFTSRLTSASSRGASARSQAAPTIGAEAAAENGAPGGADDYECNKDPHRLVRAYLRDKEDDLPLIRFWRSEWWRYQSTHYVKLDNEEVKADLVKAVRKEFEVQHRLELQRMQATFTAQKNAWNGTVAGPKLGATPKIEAVTTKLINDAIQALKSETILDFSVEQPEWLLDQGDGGPGHLIALTSGLLSVDTFLSGKTPCIRPHSHYWFSPVCLPYAYDPTASCAKWMDALDLIFQGDQDRIKVLQQWFGYCLIPTTRFQKFLILVGEGRNGKSVICSALSAVLGDGNVSNVQLESFGERFALHSTLGMLANIAAEIGEIDKSAEGMLKSLVSGDQTTFDRKGLPRIKATPTARLVFATNTPPRFTDRSDGLWRRMIYMPCDYKIPLDKVVLDMDKAWWWADSGELPGMFNWALEGLRSLLQAKAFHKAPACVEALKGYQMDCNPTRNFLLEACQEDTSGTVSCSRLYQMYRDWCLDNGYHPMANSQFGKEVKRVFLNVERKLRGAKDSRSHDYVGLSLIGEPLFSTFHPRPVEVEQFASPSCSV